MIVDIHPDNISLTRAPAFAFFKESGIAGALNFDHFCKEWSKFISLDIAKILVYVDSQENVSGIIGGLCTQCTMTADQTAQEVFWWVDPSRRGGQASILLLRLWEAWAIKKGAKRLYIGNLTALNNDKMIRLYSRLGYTPTENHYVKAI